MAVASLVPLQDYLSSSYHPDCEYVDGRLIERNGGEYDHSFLQGSVFLALKAAGLRTYVELRLQTGANRFRVPDVPVVDPGGRTLTVHALRETRTYTDRVATSDNFVSFDLQEIFHQLEEDEAE